MWVKICGITQPDQATAIAHLGATAVGVICVPASPRYVAPHRIAQITAALKAEALPVQRVGVFANADMLTLQQTVAQGGLTGVQLHGDESPLFCQQVRQQLPGVEVIKAFRVRDQQTLTATHDYRESVDKILLDAYHPQLLGGTGHALDWTQLQRFTFPQPWILAGGLTPENITTALQQLNPQGIDLSSGVERQPGVKDLTRVEQLFLALSSCAPLP